MSIIPRPSPWAFAGLLLNVSSPAQTQTPPAASHYEGTAEVSFVGADKKSLFGAFRVSHRVGEHQ
jgi:hypothetical protein